MRLGSGACACAAALAGAVVLLCPASHAQISKANQILINRGLQIEGLVATYDTFTLSRYSNANYTAVIWLWDAPRSYNSMSVLGAAPGFPWARWVYDENDMPPLGGESAYLNQLVNLQLADEWNLNDDATRTRAVNWFNAVRTNWPNTILSANNWGGQISDGNLIDFITRAQMGEDESDAADPARPRPGAESNAPPGWPHERDAHTSPVWRCPCRQALPGRRHSLNRRVRKISQIVG